MDNGTTGVQWFAAGGGILRMGPFVDAQTAWEHLRLSDPPPGGSPYPKDARVWPEWTSRETVG